MIWSVFQEVGFLTFLLFAIFFVVKEQYVELLALHFWGIAFACCYKYAITLWTPEKVVDLAMLFCVLFHKQKSRMRSLPVLKFLSIGVIILVIISSCYAIVSPKLFSYSISPFQRIILQVFAYLTPVVLLFYGPLLPVGFAPKLFKYFCRACEVGIVVGCIHYVFNVLGIPFMPILRAQAENNASDAVVAAFGSTFVTRIYGFAGEPKGLGFLIVPYIVGSVACLCNSITIRNRVHHILFLCLGVVVLFFTYSSSALITAIVSIPIILVFSINHHKRIVLPLILLIILFAVAYCVDFIGIQSFVEALQDRTFGRGAEEMANDRQEAIILEYYKDSGVLTHLFGWGLGQYSFNVPEQVEGGVLIPVQSGIVLTLSDFGIMGLVMYIVIVYLTLKITNLSSRLSGVSFAFAAAAVAKCVEVSVHGTFVINLIFLMMAYYAYHDERNNRVVL